MFDQQTSRFKCLCQDCLRVVDFETPEQVQVAHETTSSCPCGGDLCACDSCMDTAEKLIAGFRDPAVLDLLPNIDVSGWSPQRGLGRINSPTE